MATFSMTLTDR